MQLQRFFLWFAVVVLSFYLLIVGKDLLIPLVLAVFIWYLINVLTVVFTSLSVKGRHLPKAIAFAFSIIAILSISYSVINLITTNIAAVVDAAPDYQKNLDRLIAQGYQLFNVQEPPNIEQLFKGLSFTSIMSKVGGALTGVVGNAGLTAAYLIFLFIEQGFFSRKLTALVQNPARRDEIFKMLDRIGHDTRKYVGIKTLVSLLTALFSYVVMTFVGLDFAEFWAFLIFILNFIPNIGSLIATILPALLALVQFETLTPFFIVGGGVTAVQFFVANIIEPRLMGQSLNLSPLVIFLSLALWGALWGIIGMFLCVPIMVISMIILSHFPQTKPIAIMLSRDGRVRED